MAVVGSAVPVRAGVSRPRRIGPRRRLARRAAARRWASRPIRRRRPSPSCRSMPRARCAGAAISACTRGLPSSRAMPASSRSTKSTVGGCVARAARSASIIGRPTRAGSAIGRICSPSGAATASMSSSRASSRPSPPIRTPTRIASGPDRTRTRSSRTCCALRRSCAPICRRRRSVRTTSAPAFVARSPSGTGAQLNLFGVVGALAGVEEGVELNVLGLTFGIDPLDLSLKLPLAGRLGWPRSVPASTAAPDES